MKPIALIILITGTLTLSAAKPPQLQQFVIQKPTAEWFGERIKLPPRFAPDMKLKGIEEILFAPGMFKADQPDFFSYVFLFALEAKPELTPKVLRTELLTYYIGLSKNVMRNPKLDTSKFTVKLEALEKNDPMPKGALDANTIEPRSFGSSPSPPRKCRFSISSYRLGNTRTLHTATFLSAPPPKSPTHPSGKPFAKSAPRLPSRTDPFLAFPTNPIGGIIRALAEPPFASLVACRVSALGQPWKSRAHPPCLFTRVRTRLAGSTAGLLPPRVNGCTALSALPPLPRPSTLLGPINTRAA